MGLLLKQLPLWVGFMAIMVACGQDRSVEKNDLPAILRQEKPTKTAQPKPSLGLVESDAQKPSNPQVKPLTQQITNHNRLDLDDSFHELKIKTNIKNKTKKSVIKDSISAKAGGIKLYGLYLSHLADCSDPKPLFSTINPEYVLFSNEGVSLPTAMVEAGTYPCMILEVSDQFKFIPAVGFQDVCLEDEEYIVDLCPKGGKSVSPESGKDIICTEKEDRVAIYFSTKSISTGVAADDSTELSGNPLIPPSDNMPEDGLKLSKSFFMHNSSTSTILQLDLADRISKYNDKCVSLFPLFQLFR